MERGEKSRERREDEGEKYTKRNTVQSIEYAD
jgi:hypothetical protein